MPTNGHFRCYTASANRNGQVRPDGTKTLLETKQPFNNRKRGSDSTIATVTEQNVAVEAGPSSHVSMFDPLLVEDVDFKAGCNFTRNVTGNDLASNIKGSAISESNTDRSVLMSQQNMPMLLMTRRLTLHPIQSLCWISRYAYQCSNWYKDEKTQLKKVIT